MVVREDAAFLTDDAREDLGIPARPGVEVEDGHAGADTKESEHLGRFARRVASAFLFAGRFDAQITPSAPRPSFLPSGSVTEMY
jgi:hypothetical protein